MRRIAISACASLVLVVTIGWLVPHALAQVNSHGTAFQFVQQPLRDPPPVEQPQEDEALADETPSGETRSSVVEDEAPQPTEEFNPQMVDLRRRMRRTLDLYYARPEDASVRSPWGVMHSLIAFGVDTQLRVDGREVNAIGWLCWNQPCRGMRLMYARDGRIYGHEGVGVQGHEGQFLSMLAQSRVPKDFVMKVSGQEFTVADLVESEMLTCRAGTELTFKLIGLAHYLPTDARWRNNQGEEWDLARLIREELAQPVLTAACGGTHRLMGFAYAVQKRKKQGGSITGQWLRAEKFVSDYHDYIFSLQNPNGSFSTNWMHSRGDSQSPERYVQTTGHILEFMVYSMPEEELQDPRLVRTVDFLTRLLWDYRDSHFEVGPRGHALHALELYNQRVFGAKPGGRTVNVARQP